MAIISASRRLLANYLTTPTVWLLAKTPITPSILTWIGFGLALVTAAIIVTGNILIAGLLILFSGYFDILDGALARYTNKTTKFGAILDATLDRLSEAVLLLGILGLFLITNEQSMFILIDREWAILLVGLTFLGSTLVSYIKARAEANGIKCEIGIFTRTERVVILALGLLINQITICLAVIALFSIITAGQRLFYVYQQTKKHQN